MVYVAGIAASAATGEHAVATAGDSVEDVAGRPGRAEVNVGADSKNNETREYNGDGGRTGNPVVPRMRDRY